MMDYSDLKVKTYSVDTLHALGNTYKLIIPKEDNFLDDKTYVYNSELAKHIEDLIEVVEKDKYHEGKNNPLAENLKDFNGNGVYSTKAVYNLLNNLRKEYFPGLKFK